MTSQGSVETIQVSANRQIYIVTVNNIDGQLINYSLGAYDFASDEWIIFADDNTYVRNTLEEITQLANSIDLDNLGDQ